MVRWSRRARDDVKAIHDRIDNDAPLNSKIVVREIRRKADTLANLAFLGRKVPEVDDEHVREISAYSWRIIYQLRRGDVFIVTLLHKRRQPSNEDLNPDTSEPK